MIKVIELFSGIGSQTQALKNIGIDHKVVGISEIDKYAVTSYEAIHGEVNNLGDITKIEQLPFCDFLTYSFPCQDLSIAGKGAGIKKGTRSGLLFEVERLLLIAKQNDVLPSYLLLENVKNLVSKNHKHDFDNWLKFLESLGYSNFWQVLNAKDYRIPQNRERVFVVSTLKKINYKFPKPKQLEIFLKDLLETTVDEKYYLSEDKIHSISRWKAYQKPFEKVQGKNSIAPTLTARGAGEEHSGMITYSDNLDNTTNLQKECLRIKEATKKGYKEAYDGDSVNLEQPNSKTRRGRVGNQVAQTLTTSCNQGVVNNYRIRKLTPKECWRLMGFDDEDFEKASQVNSNAQLYKQAGNSIVVNVLEDIFEELFLKEHNEVKKIIVEEIPPFPGFESRKIGVGVNDSHRTI